MVILSTLLFLITSTLGETRYAEAILYPDAFNGKGEGMYGRVVFTQGQDDKTVRLDVYVEGLEPNSLHGLHIHTAPVENGNCSLALGHWNPLNVSHGTLNSKEHHFGDFSNVKVGDDGNKLLVIQAGSFSLWGEGDKSPFNRAIILHEDPDDLGRGGDDGSKATGNAGARLICGNIVQKTEDPDAPVVTTSTSTEQPAATETEEGDKQAENPGGYEDDWGNPDDDSDNDEDDPAAENGDGNQEPDIDSPDNFPSATQISDDPYPTASSATKIASTLVIPILMFLYCI